MITKQLFVLLEENSVDTLNNIGNQNLKADDQNVIFYETFCLVLLYTSIIAWVFCILITSENGILNRIIWN